MSHTTLLALTGSLFLFLTGVVCLYIAVTLKWASYSRWVLGIMGAAQFIFVANRTASIAGLINSDTAIVLSGMIGAATLAQIVALGIAHYFEDRMHEKIRNVWVEQKEQINERKHS